MGELDRIEIPRSKARRVRNGYLRYAKDEQTYVEVRAEVATEEEKAKAASFVGTRPNRRAAGPAAPAEDTTRRTLLVKANYARLSTDELTHVIRWAQETIAQKHEADRKREEARRQIEKLISERGLDKADVLKSMITE